MAFSPVFYKELSVDEDNILSANLTENNQIEQIKLKKSKIYAISGLSIDQELKLNIEGRKAPLEKQYLKGSCRKKKI